MRRLGYDRYAVQGTDVGAGVAGMVAMVDSERVAGMHLTGTTAAMPFGPPVELEGLSAADRARAERFNAFQTDGLGYLHIQATRPQTLAYGLHDSPAGQLAWIVEKFQDWTDPAAELPTDAVDRAQLLTNVTIYWFTGAGASSAHATYEGMQAWRAIAAQQAEQPGGPSAPGATATHAPPPPAARAPRDPEPSRRDRRPAWPCSPPTPPSAPCSTPTTPCTGRSSTAAATSPPWRCPTCWSGTCGPSFAGCAETGRAGSSPEAPTDRPEAERRPEDRREEWEPQAGRVPEVPALVGRRRRSAAAMLR